MSKAVMGENVRIQLIAKELSPCPRSFICTPEYFMLG
jgi:hypothetical protein